MSKINDGGPAYPSGKSRCTLRQRVRELEHQVRMAGKHADYLTKERVKATKDAAAAEAKLAEIAGLENKKGAELSSVEQDGYWVSVDELKTLLDKEQGE